MIVASRRIPSSTNLKLHSKLKLSCLVETNQYIMASPQSSSSLCTERTSQPPLFSGDWPADLFTGEYKSRAISVLNTDRDNSSFSFKHLGKSTKKAAVLVPFCYDVNGRPGLLCNLRSVNLTSHSGEISFPGGTLEPEDNDDVITAALRETREELGISKDQVEFWTTCRVFPTVSTRMGVVPVVGFVNNLIDPDKLDINRDEVDHAFVITLDHLCNPSNWGEMDPMQLGSSRVSFKLPIYKNLTEISGGLDGVPLWGLTAFITHLVLSAFIPHKYTRKLSYIELMTEKKKEKKATADNEKPNSKL